MRLLLSLFGAAGGVVLVVAGVVMLATHPGPWTAPVIAPAWVRFLCVAVALSVAVEHFLRWLADKGGTP